MTNVQRAVEHIYPYVEEHAKTKVVADKTNPVPKSRLILLFVLCKFIILYILQSINIVYLLLQAVNYLQLESKLFFREIELLFLYYLSFF